MLQFLKNRSLGQWIALCIALFLCVMLLGIYLTAHNIGGHAASLATLAVCFFLLGVQRHLMVKEREQANTGSPGLLVFSMRPQPMSEEQALAKFKHCQEHPEEYCSGEKPCGCRWASMMAYPCPPIRVVEIPCEEHKAKQVAPA